MNKIKYSRCGAVMMSIGLVSFCMTSASVAEEVKVGYNDLSIVHEDLVDLQISVPALEPLIVYDTLEYVDLQAGVSDILDAPVVPRRDFGHHFYNVPMSYEIQHIVYEQCVDYGIEEYYETALAQIVVESSGDAEAISSTNDYGLMQINKCNHKYLSEELGITDIMDPEQNIQAGIYLMSYLLEKYEDTSVALMAYNMGEGNMLKCRAEGNNTSGYSREILSTRSSLSIEY